MNSTELSEYREYRVVWQHFIKLAFLLLQKYSHRTNALQFWTKKVFRNTRGRSDPMHLNPLYPNSFIYKELQYFGTRRSFLDTVCIAAFYKWRAILRNFIFILSVKFCILYMFWVNVIIIIYDIALSINRTFFMNHIVETN